MTPAEIAKALRCAATVQTGDEPCASCPFCQVEMLTEAQKAQLHCEEWRGCDVDGVALAAADLIERLEKEKAALMEIAKARPICATCKHHIGCKAVELADCRRCIRRKDCVCVQCVGWAKWEWKGLVENK